MEIKDINQPNLTQDEIELLKIADGGDDLYDKSHLTYLCRQIVTDNTGSKGFFKAYTYKNSLRFLALMNDSISESAADWLAEKINGYITDNADKDMIMLRYAQASGFSDILLNRFDYKNAYRYCRYFISRGDINNADFGMKGLEKRRFTEDMIDLCIETMEEAFTPFPDSPGTFRQDKERIKREYTSSEKGGAELFFKDNALIGFCGHNCGHFTEVCIRNEYQDKGYGEVIIRSVLQSVYEQGYNAELYARHDNVRAIHLYEKVGFKKLYEAVRVNLNRKAR
jgi:ribosomal protein S18 acetylase RimI-like enzyme